MTGGDAGDAVLGWEDKEVNFGHAKPMACQLGEVSVRQLR